MNKVLITEILTALDSYKLSHWQQLLPGLSMIYENCTARSLKHLPKEIRLLTNDTVIVSGVADTWNVINESFKAEFFDKPFDDAMDIFSTQQFYFSGSTNVERYRELHLLGYLPIKVKALKDGTRINAKIPYFTIQNTLAGFEWLVGALETIVSNETWKSVAIATVAFGFRVLAEKTAFEQGYPIELAQWQNHNFADRGMSGGADARKCGVSHNLFSLGTDGFGSVNYIIKNYTGVNKDSFICGSIPASEHMTETLAIQYFAKQNGGDLLEAEATQIKRFLTELYPSGMAARVSDSYNYPKVVDELMAREDIKELVLNRQPDSLGMCKFVLRPDSGVPEDVICGTAKVYADMDLFNFDKPQSDSYVLIADRYYFYEVDKDTLTEIDRKYVPFEVKGTVERLWEIYGGTITDKGYKVLNSKIGMIYGDSITIKRATEIINRLAQKGFAAINCFFGVGSYTYQMVSRDTLGIALKATYAIVDGVGIDLNKDPIGDSTKKSAKGLLRVDYNDVGEIALFQEQSFDDEEKGLLETILCDGVFSGDLDFFAIRNRCSEHVQRTVKGIINQNMLSTYRY